MVSRYPRVERLASQIRSALPSPAKYRLISGLFLRLLALIYLVAFASLGVQILGLAGYDGILPFAEELRLAGQTQGLVKSHPDTNQLFFA